MIKVTRDHEICFGHRVWNHEGRCARLHGHNWKFEFTLVSNGDLDSVGRVIDFTQIKSILCQWLEDNWDHRFLYYEKDKTVSSLVKYALGSRVADEKSFESYVAVPFNPTSENLADHFLKVVAPSILGKEVKLVKVVVWETSKCRAIAELGE